MLRYWALPPWDCSPSRGRHFGPQVTSSYLGSPMCPWHLLPALSAPPRSSHLQLPCHGGPRNLPFWLVVAAHRAWSFMLPLTEHYLCSWFVWYKNVLILFKKRTSVSFPVHPRRCMVGISKSGNNVKPFEALGSIQKAVSSLKTLHDLNPWKYFNLSTLISTTITTCVMNKPKLFLFWQHERKHFYGFNSPWSITAGSAWNPTMQKKLESFHQFSEPLII